MDLIHPVVSADIRLRVRAVLVFSACLCLVRPAEGADPLRLQELHTDASVRNDLPREVRTDTLDIHSFADLLAAVESNNGSLKAGVIRSDMLASSIDQAGVLPDPTVSAGLAPFPVHTARGEQVFQLRVEQMLPWPGKRRLQRDLSEWEAVMGIEDVHQKKAQLFLEAVHAALAVDRAERLDAETRAFRDRLNRFEDIALSRYETGAGEQQHVWKLQLAEAAQDQALLKLGEQRSAAIAALQQQVHTPVRVDVGAFSAGVPDVPAADPTDRSEYRRLEAAHQKAGVSRQAAGLANRPDWGLSATWMAMKKSDMPASSDGRDALGIGVMMRIPLGRSEQKSREESARLREVELQQSMEAFVASWEGMWQEQTAHLEGLHDQLRHLDERLIPVAEAMLESSVQAYAAGRSGFLDLLDAERTAFELRQQRIEVTTRLAMTRWTLYRLSGQWERTTRNDTTLRTDD